jgi:succinyl-diaminopimelate desuccinylase
MNDSTTILKKLIRLNSENPPGKTRQIIEWIRSWAEKNGIPATTQWIHLDTVPIGDKRNWKYDPLGADEDEDGFIYGRGSADMKGGVAACLGAIKFLKNSVDIDNLPYKIVFLGTSDEEVNFRGAINALELNIMDTAEFLIVPEPTGLDVGIAEKGMLWLLIKARGRAAHGSTPEKGINAIEELVRIFPTLHAEVPTDTHQVLGQSTLNIGVIKGGKSTNVVPEYAEIHCDYRLVPPVDTLDYGKKIDAVVREYGQSSPAQLETEIKQNFNAVQSSKDNEFVSLFIETANPKQIIGLNYATDAAVLVTPPSKRVPFVIFGPGDPKAIHVANERVSKVEVKKTEFVLLEFLKKVLKSNK